MIALSSESWAWMRSNRLWMADPNILTTTDTHGRASRAIPVSLGLNDSIMATATMNRTTVVVAYMTAGPIIMRTALRSFVARDMRSPVRLRW